MVVRIIVLCLLPLPFLFFVMFLAYHVFPVLVHRADGSFMASAVAIAINSKKEIVEYPVAINCPFAEKDVHGLLAPVFFLPF